MGPSLQALARSILRTCTSCSWICTWNCATFGATSNLSWKGASCTCYQSPERLDRVVQGGNHCIWPCGQWYTGQWHSLLSARLLTRCQCTFCTWHLNVPLELCNNVLHLVLWAVFLSWHRLDQMSEASQVSSKLFFFEVYLAYACSKDCKLISFFIYGNKYFHKIVIKENIRTNFPHLCNPFSWNFSPSFVFVFVFVCLYLSLLTCAKGLSTR